MSPTDSRHRAWWEVGGLCRNRGDDRRLTAFVFRQEALVMMGAAVLGGVLGVLLATVLAQILMLLAGLLGLDEDGPGFPNGCAPPSGRSTILWDEVQP